MYGSIQDRRETGKWETDKKRQKGNQTLVGRKVRIPVPEDPTHKNNRNSGYAVVRRQGSWFTSRSVVGIDG